MKLEKILKFAVPITLLTTGVIIYHVFKETKYEKEMRERYKEVMFI